MASSTVLCHKRDERAAERRGKRSRDPFRLLPLVSVLVDARFNGTSRRPAPTMFLLSRFGDRMGATPCSFLRRLTDSPRIESSRWSPTTSALFRPFSPTSRRSATTFDVSLSKSRKLQTFPRTFTIKLSCICISLFLYESSFEKI